MENPVNQERDGALDTNDDSKELIAQQSPDGGQQSGGQKGGQGGARPGSGEEVE